MADLFKLLGSVGGTILGGPVGGMVGGFLGDVIGGSDSDVVQATTMPLAFGASQFLPSGGSQPSRPGSTPVRASDAFKDIQTITSPAYEQAGQTMSDLLTKARRRYEPLQSQTYQTQLEDVISGTTDITTLPGFQARSRALTNVLASKGLSQSESASLATFEPLIASTFEDLEQKAQAEKLMNLQIASDIANMFKYEAGTVGMMPVREAEQVIGSGLQSRAIDVGQEQFATTLAEQQKIRKSKQEADMLSGVFEFGMEYGPDLWDFLTGEGE